MFRIGDFSQLGQVSVRTLRLYDELGLIKPARVDDFSGYRYYTLEQLPRLNRILMLKDLGLSLEQIAHLLRDPISVERLRQMLTVKQTEIVREMQENTERLGRIEARLRQMEMEGRLTGYDVVLKNVAPRKIVSIRKIVPSLTDMYADRCALFQAVYGWLEAHAIPAQGPELAVYHNAEYTEQDIDMEAAVMVDIGDAPLADSGVVNIRELPGAVTMACLVCQSRPQDVGQALVGLYTWIGENEYSTHGPYREIHWYGRELDLKNYDAVTMEMQIPVVKNTT